MHSANATNEGRCRRQRRRQRGQGMTEYIIIVALVAIGSVFFVTVFGDNVRALFGASANALVGHQQRAADLRRDEISDIKRTVEDFDREGP